MVSCRQYNEHLLCVTQVEGRAEQLGAGKHGGRILQCRERRWPLGWSGKTCMFPLHPQECVRHFLIPWLIYKYIVFLVLKTWMRFIPCPSAPAATAAPAAPGYQLFLLLDSLAGPYLSAAHEVGLRALTSLVGS